MADAPQSRKEGLRRLHDRRRVGFNRGLKMHASLSSITQIGVVSVETPSPLKNSIVALLRCLAGATIAADRSALASAAAASARARRRRGRSPRLRQAIQINVADCAKIHANQGTRQYREGRSSARRRE
jgi:hypothetical protein